MTIMIIILNPTSADTITIDNNEAKIPLSNDAVANDEARAHSRNNCVNENVTVPLSNATLAA